MGSLRPRLLRARHECDAAAELDQARRHFFLPRRFVDPFGNATTVAYDPHDLLPVEIRDAVGNMVRARDRLSGALRPIGMTDANGIAPRSRSMRWAWWSARRSWASQASTSAIRWTASIADLDEATILEHLAASTARSARDPATRDARGSSTTCSPTTRTRDDPQPQPAAVYTLARETHVADLPPGAADEDPARVLLLRRLRARDPEEDPGRAGPARRGRAGRQSALGRQRLDDLQQQGQAGPPVRAVLQRDHTFRIREHASASAPILFYDPVERVVATLHPNHTYEKVVFDPWRQETWDVNDTVLQSDPAQDPDVGDFFRSLPDADYLPTWYDQRSRGATRQGRTAGGHEDRRPCRTRRASPTSTRSAAPS